MQILGIVIALIVITVMGNFPLTEKATKFVLEQHPVKRIKTLGVPFWMGWIRPAVSIATSLANRQDLEWRS